MDYSSFNHHHRHDNRYVHPPPPPPNNYSDDRSNPYAHHLMAPVHLPPPPPLYPTLPPPPPPLSVPLPPPPSYNPHQSHFTFLDAQNPSFVNHNRSSYPQSRVSNQFHYDYRTDVNLPERHLNSQSENYFKPNGSPQVISNLRFRDRDHISVNDRYTAGRDISNIASQDRYSPTRDFVEKYEPHYVNTSPNDRIWDNHGEEDSTWVMKGKKNSFQSNRVRDDREEFKQVQKKSVLLRIGKPNKTSKNRNHDQQSNNSKVKGKDKDRNKDSSVYKDKRIDEDREHSPVDLDVSFKSNTLVAKAVVTPSSPMSDKKNTQPSNKKIKRITEFDSPISKLGDCSGSSSRGLDTPSSSEKATKKVKDNNSVNDGVKGSSSVSVLDGGGAGNERLSFRLKKKRKLMTLKPLASSFQLDTKDDKSGKIESAKKSPVVPTSGEELNVKDDKSGKIESAKKSPVVPTPGEDLISSKVDESLKDMFLEKDGLEVENRSLDRVNSFGNGPTENTSLAAEKVSVINDDLANENGFSLNLENDTEKISADVKLSVCGTDISDPSEQDQIEIQKCPTESYTGFDAVNISDSLCNGPVELQEEKTTDDMNSLDSCSDEIIIVSESSDGQGFLEDLSSIKEKESQMLEDTSKQTDYDGISKCSEDGFKDSVNSDIFAEDNAMPVSSVDKDEDADVVESICTPVQTLGTDHTGSSTYETGSFVTDLNDKSVESIADLPTSFSGSQILTSNSTDNTVTDNVGNICEQSVSKDGPLLNSHESSLEDSRTGIQLDVAGLLANTKKVSSASQGSTFRSLDSNTKLQGPNMSMKKPSHVSALPRAFAGHTTPVFTNSRINNPAKNIAKPRTWHRSTSVPVPLPPKPVVTVQNSYVRTGNTLLRKPAPVSSNTAGPVETKNNASNTNLRSGGPTAPVVRPKTPPLSSRPNSPDCPTYPNDIPSLPMEDQNGISNNIESQKTLDEGVTEKKIQYLKPKTNQIVAAASGDQSVQDIDKTQALSSDGYYKKRKNQLIRTSVGDDSANVDVPKVTKINIKRPFGLSKKYKHLKFPSVWTLNSQSLGKEKDGVPLYQKLRPHLFPWKRSVTNLPSNSPSTSISRKLQHSRKRNMIYTRSKHGFSLRMSKLLSVGGSGLKWSKSLEKNSKRANEEATLAVAAAAKKKREQHERKSRNNMSRDKIYRIGLVRYKMDPSRRTLQRISDEEPSTSVKSKEEIRKSYVPKRLKIGQDEYLRIGNGNQLVRNPKRRTRIFANEKLRWSLHTARSRLAKKKKFCQFFTRFGKCNKDDGKCPYMHDSSKVAVCTKFLNGSCSNPNCKLTHKVIPERMQDCSYFLEGLCSNKDCPYRHVKVNSGASICEGFLKGYCADGNECRKKHTYACPVFEATGTCSQGTKCKLHHPKTRKTGLKRKQQHSMEQQQRKNTRGRYFGSVSSVETMPISENCNSKDDVTDISCQQGIFAEYISLDFGNEKSGEVIGDQSMMLVSETPSLGAAEFDDKTKPIRLINRIVFESD
ncbi:uncharacterized protein [Rutidosis leptorrhynchoides]|uniref:uncharacterized protein n=1 Tax=Rutidosis leptorrhynchoides TaxID=125765 RepID=UPI003A98E2DF